MAYIPPESLPCTECKATVSRFDYYQGYCNCHDTRDPANTLFRCTDCGEQFCTIYCAECLALEYRAENM